MKPIACRLNTPEEVKTVNDLFTEIGMTQKMFKPEYYANKEPAKESTDPLAAAYIYVQEGKLFLDAGYRISKPHAYSIVQVDEFVRTLRMLKELNIKPSI